MERDQWDDDGPPPYVKPEPNTVCTPTDATNYFLACELVRRLKVELSTTGGRCAQLLKNGLKAARTTAKTLAPLELTAKSKKGESTIGTLGGPHPQEGRNPIVKLALKFLNRENS